MPHGNRTMIQILLYYEKNAKDEVKFLCRKAACKFVSDAY